MGLIAKNLLFSSSPCAPLWFVSGLVLLACEAAPVASTLELPRTPRQPDGVVLEPEPSLPRAEASAPARGIVALKEPIGDGVVRAAVDAFFVPFTSHDPEALDGVLSRSARLLDSHGGSSYTVVRDELLRRVAAFKLAGVRSVHIDALERFELDDLAVHGARPRPAEMRKGDILVRVHLTVPHPGGDRLFGDVIVLLLRADEEIDGPGRPRLRVAGFDEQDAR